MSNEQAPKAKLAKVTPSDFAAFLTEQGEKSWEIYTNEYGEFEREGIVPHSELIDILEFRYIPLEEYFYVWEWEDTWDILEETDLETVPLIGRQDLARYIIYSDTAEFIWFSPTENDAANGGVVILHRVWNDDEDDH